MKILIFALLLGAIACEPIPKAKYRVSQDVVVAPITKPQDFWFRPCPFPTEGRIRDSRVDDYKVYSVRKYIVDFRCADQKYYVAEFNEEDLQYSN